MSEIMLQQTQVKTVIPYWERWMQRLPTLRSLADAREETVLKLWEGLGYYSRARNLHKAARILCAEHDGRFPKSFDEVLALPGVGRYTAGAICSIAFGEPTPILDGNVARVLTRLFEITGDPKARGTQEQLWSLSSQLVLASSEQKACSELNQGLMELGALICTSRDPACTGCPLKKSCRAFRNGRVAEFPQIAARPAPVQRRFLAVIFRRGARVLVRKRAAGLVNGGLWEFPNAEVARGRPPPQFALWHARAKPFATIKHSITNNRITLEAAALRVNGQAAALATKLTAEWRSLDELHGLPFTSAHAKLRALICESPSEALDQASKPAHDA